MISETIKELISEYMAIWWNTPCEFPELGEPVSSEKQASIESECEDIVRSTVGHDTWESDMRNIVCRAGRTVMGFTATDMELLFDGGFLSAASDFSDKAREFDPDIVMSDVMQAIRNVWIMNCIQLLKGLKVKLTPSVFSYSMLYPYTDNFLDRPETTRDEKRSKCDTLCMMLKGKATKPADSYEEGLKKLVALIEGEYSRESNPGVYKSLLDIHAAQEKSLMQQIGNISPYETDILGISIAKGGTSVLADAFLVMGELTKEEKDFIFGFGIFLQLADDLQDTLDDMKNGHMTIFSQTAGKWPLDSITNRLFNLCPKILEKSGCFNSPHSVQLLNIMEKSFRMLVLHAVADNSRLYSANYVKRLERYSPLGFKRIRKLDKKAETKYKRLMEKSRKTGHFL